ncbi:hypothetical protein, partial [Enterobacter cloacae complex sp. 4DZ3-17B2]|uniref:hypothetical protein n=1 Tax=Enterobacter cloacae complex sp. 4DZ3-17B2 TaxID=2511990 RepID=UPI001CA534D9
KKDRASNSLHKSLQTLSSYNKRLSRERRINMKESRFLFILKNKITLKMFKKEGRTRNFM